MINLYQLTGYWGIPSPSPFCMKLETYMRMAGIPFRSINILDALVAPANRKAPKGKIPFIEYEGQTIGDSSLILEFLKKKFGNTIDSHLNSRENSEGLAIQRLFEDHYFWVIVYSRWLDKKGWAVTRPEFFNGLPPLIRQIVPFIRKAKMRKVLHINGIARHNEQDIYAMGIQDLDAFASLLENKPFIFGDKPSSFDAIAHGFLVNTMQVPFDLPIKRHALQIETLVSYCKRIEELYYKT